MYRGTDFKCTEVLTFENACLGLHGSAIEPLNARLEKLINKEVRVYIYI
jgi:hypothetical protein